MGVPSVYLWDCNSAGTIVNMFLRLADDHSLRWMDEYQGHDRPSFISELEDGDQQQNDNFSNLSENSVSSFKVFQKNFTARVSILPKLLGFFPRNTSIFTGDGL